jgi:hypothetical protein
MIRLYAELEECAEIRTLVAHDLIIDGTALELHDTDASLLLGIEMIMH